VSDSNRRTIWIAHAHRDEESVSFMRVDKKLKASAEELAICTWLRKAASVVFPLSARRRGGD
jgi:hypothetical protein